MSILLAFDCHLETSEPQQAKGNHPCFPLSRRQGATGKVFDPAMSSSEEARYGNTTEAGLGALKMIRGSCDVSKEIAMKLQTR